MKNLFFTIALTVVFASCSKLYDESDFANDNNVEDQFQRHGGDSLGRRGNFDLKLPVERHGGDSVGRRGNFDLKLPVERHGGDSVGRRGNFDLKLPVERHGGDSI